MAKQQTKIKALQIGIASPERIRGWSHGEVTKSETINYKTSKPEKGGLFDQVIFGPVKDYHCICGKYSKSRHRGITCDRCGVDIVEQTVRRERMGHIDLACPVAHIWMTKELPSPSKISLLLNISYKEVEQVVYFVNYIVLNEGIFANDEKKIFEHKDIIDLTSAKNQSTSRNKLIKLLKRTEEVIAETNLAKDPEWNKKTDMDYRFSKLYRESIKDSTMPFSISDLFAFVEKWTGFRVGIGAEAIQELLKNLDLDDEYNSIQEELKSQKNSHDQKVKKLLRRLEVIKWIQNSGNKPEWMILNVLPVTPPETRPIIQLETGRFTTSDINNFYRKIIIRNERLKRVIEAKAPKIILNNEKRMLQEAVDALFDNGGRRKPVIGKDRRPLKSLSSHLKGKQGLFRQNLLGKRVDYSGRSVIVIGPELKMYQVGIPAIMILKLFKPFIVRELINKRDEHGLEITPIAVNTRAAEQMILEQKDVIWPVVEKVIKSRPVLLNRAPTLHRLGIQAFEPKMIEGKAIRLHPLVTPAFNADFDGDQMAVHVPLGKEAINEARSILLASWHILGPKDGKPVIAPTQDMVLGNYYLTIEGKGLEGEGIIFGTVEQALKAYENKKLHIHALIGISTSAFPNKKDTFAHEGILITTVGKIILNNALPESFPYINDGDSTDGSYNAINNKADIVPHGEDPRAFIENGYKVKAAFDKKIMSNIIEKLYKNFDIQFVPETMDKIKSLGFKYSMISAITISAFDVPKYDAKEEYFKEADEKVKEWKEWAELGYVNDDERYKGVIEVWTNVKDKVQKDIKDLLKAPEYGTNSIVVMANSGARGNLAQFTQLSGMRGLMSRSYNYDQKRKSTVARDTIEVPIKHSFIEGLTINEFFNSSYGARKGSTDTAMKTSKSGYMTRKLVDATQEVIVNNEDCGTFEGLEITAIINTKDKTVIESLSQRIEKRYSINDIVNPNNGEIIVAAGDLITEINAKVIEEELLKYHTIKAEQVAATKTFDNDTRREQFVKEYALKKAKVLVRSPLHCLNEHGICQKCFGYDLSTNLLIESGTAIGVVAAQSIGEPGTQLTMRTFHTGGVAEAGGNITQGFERLKQLFDCVAPKPFEKSIISQVYGKVESITEDEVIVTNKHESIAYAIKPTHVLRVEEGDDVVPGSKITEGSIEINDLLKVAGIEKVRHYIIKEVQKIYRLQGIEISDKYIEVIIKQLTDKVQIQHAGDSDLFIGQVISINAFRQIVQDLLLAKKEPPFAINKVYGLEDAPAKSGSFLSAASFQDTKKTLTDAVVKGQVDHLFGLKENVILGNTIPAGTGLKPNDEVNKFGEEMHELEY